MAADSLHGAAERVQPAHRSIDELDAAICTLARQMNAETYRMLMLVREFDERFGWAKWGLRNCPEWLAWRCGFTLSTAREKVRTAHALRAMPVISAAFADGLLSYSKVRALTRVGQLHDEDRCLRTLCGRPRRKSRSGVSRSATSLPNRPAARGARGSGVRSRCCAITPAES